jgi:acyl-ACP thioesterase
MDFYAFKFPQFHSHTLKIHSYEVDFNQRLTVTALFNYLQEIAWEHAHLLEYGWEHLLKKGWFWVLSRVEVEVFRLPKWTEEVTLITWPRGVDGVFALRDFEVYDSQGNKIIAATSSWLVLNIKTHRPVRSDWYSDFNFANRSALGHNASKLVEPARNPEFTERFDVRIGDIDMNQHVNNVRYIDWAYNTYSIEHFRNFHPSRVIVNFNTEGKPNDSITVTRFQNADNESVVEINNAETEKNLCRLLFGWEKN